MTKDDKAGLYLTAIIHLVVLIALLSTSIGAVLSKGDIFEMDYSETDAPDIPDRVEDEGQEAEDETFGEAISRKVEALIAGNSGASFRNVATGGELKDDRGTDASKLYDDARKLAEDLKNGFEVEETDNDYVSVPALEKKERADEEKPYSGPSVLSWQLDGRQASHLPIPAYRCYGGGMVTVTIGVDPSGKVVYAKIQDETSSTDTCLRDFAIRAAKLSRFSSKPGAPARQAGQIVYQFIAQ